MRTGLGRGRIGAFTMDHSKGKKKYTAVRKLTDNRFLNLYEMDALTDEGNPFSYYFASRNSQENLPLLTGETRSNGIVIYPLWKEDPSRIVMIRQYRYPLDSWIYELPAGLIDEGETAGEAAAREMKEETGLLFEPYEGGSPSMRRPVYLGAGMTDETSTSVFGLASGQITDSFREKTESIEVVLVDKKEAARILSKERISLRAAFLLPYFLRSDRKEPFAFLDL